MGFRLTSWIQQERPFLLADLSAKVNHMTTTVFLCLIILPLVGVVAGNFTYQAVRRSGRYNWSQAFERSFFQVWYAGIVVLAHFLMIHT